MAQAHFPLKDLNTTVSDSGSTPSYFQTIGSVTYFTAFSSVHGRELWKTDGTESGTVLVKDIRPGTASSDITQIMANLGGILLFFADDGTHGSELWRSDGTAAGTYMIKDINAGSSGMGYPGRIAIMGGYAYFTANDGVRGSELWRTNGTPEGTQIVHDINPGAGDASPENPITMGMNVYFTAFHPDYGREVWKTDGSPAGTALLKDVRVGVGSAGPNDLAVVSGNTLYFDASETTGRNLWKSDGTSIGTVQVKDLDTASTANNTLARLTAVGSQLFFLGSTSTTGTELWRSNGTNAGTVMVRDLRSGTMSGVSFSDTIISVLGTVAYFRGTDGTNTGIWKSDGSSAGTTYLGGPSTGTLSEPGLAYAGNLYLRFGTELWKTNGSQAGTNSLLPGTLEVNNTPVLLNTSLLFAAQPAGGWPTNYELWRSSGETGNATLIKNIQISTADSSPVNFTKAGNRAYFIAFTPETGNELWTSDGTETGTTLVREIRPGTASAGTSRMLPVGNGVYFHANDGTHGVELWKSDGSLEGTVMVADLRPGPDSSTSDSFAPFGKLGNLVFFQADDGSTGAELWVTDGTAAGTMLLMDINPGPAGSSPGQHRGVVLNGILYFDAFTQNHGREIWRTDGTPSGTYQVADIRSGAASGLATSVSNLPFGLVVDGELYFAANNGFNGSELWKSDGTAAGTSMVLDIDPGTSSAVGNPFTGMLDAAGFQGGLCFAATTPDSGTELWFSDGTSSGTFRVSDLWSGAGSSDPLPGVVMGSAYFFAASDPAGGQELWRWNGGSSVPTRVRDIAPGAASSGIRSLLSVGGNVYFSASSSGVGFGELWQSDGTSAGTTLIPSAFPGTDPQPMEAIALGRHLVFSAFYPHLGREIGSYALPVPDLAVEQPIGSLLASGAAAVDFGAVPVGAPPLVRTFRFSNTGTASLSGLSLEIDGEPSHGFTAAPPGLPETLLPGEHADLTISFHAEVVGEHAAQLVVSSNDPDENPFVVNLLGVGTDPNVFTWNGLGSDDKWSTPGNWIGGVAPPNDGTAKIVFGSSSRNRPVMDAAWHVHGLTFPDGGISHDAYPPFPPMANTLYLGMGGISNLKTTSSITRVTTPVTLQAHQTWSSTYGGLEVHAPLNLGSNTLTINNQSTGFPISLIGNTTGEGRIQVDRGILNFGYAPHSYTGGTRLNGPLTAVWGTPTSLQGNFDVNGGMIYFYQVGIGNDGTFRGTIRGGGTVMLDGTRIGFDPSDTTIVESRLSFFGSDEATMLVTREGNLAFHGSLDLASSWNGNLDLHTGSVNLSFAQSSAESWGGGPNVLNIKNYSYGHDTIRFGTDASGLTEAQLAKIRFVNYGNAPGAIDSAGYVTPVAPIIQLEFPDGTVMSEFQMLDFGMQMGNPDFSYLNYYTDRTIMIRNVGNAPLTLQTAYAGSDPMSRRFHFFVPNPPFGNVLAPGQAQSMTLRFQPSAGTDVFVSSTLRIDSSDPARPVRYVSLYGGIAVPVPIESAMQSAGLSGENAAPGSMPFGDGVPNLLKYAFNMNLAGADAATMTPGSGTSGLPFVGLASRGGETTFRIEYLQRKGSGLNYEPQVSNGLDDFQPMGGTTTIEEIDAYWQRVVVEQPIDPRAQPARFGRVKIDQ